MRGARDPRVRGRARPGRAAMSVETITLGCRLNFAESETIARDRSRGRGLDRRQQLRGDQRSRAPDPPGDPPRAPPRPERARSWSPAAPPSSNRSAFEAMPEVSRVVGNADKLNAFAANDVMTPVPVRPHAQGEELRRGPDRLRPPLHLLLDLAGARAEPLAAVRGDPRRGRARDRPRRQGDRADRRRHHRLSRAASARFASACSPPSRGSSACACRRSTASRSTTPCSS